MLLQSRGGQWPGLGLPGGLSISDEAIAEVSLACGMEAEFRRLAAEEGDLESLRGDPRFDGLLMA